MNCINIKYLFHIIIYKLFFFILYIKNIFYKIGVINLNCINIKYLFHIIIYKYYKIGDINLNCINIKILISYYNI